MKFISKTLTVIFTTIASVGTLAGTIMFGVAGAPTVLTLDKDKYMSSKSLEFIAVGCGLLNYDARASSNFYNKYDVFLKEGKERKDEFEFLIKQTENHSKTLKDSLPLLNEIVKTAQDNLANAESGNDVNAIILAKESLQKATNDLDGTILNIQLAVSNNNWWRAAIDAPIAYDVTIAGIIVMSVGILFAALSAAMAINLNKYRE